MRFPWSVIDCIGILQGKKLSPFLCNILVRYNCIFFFVLANGTQIWFRACIPGDHVNVTGIYLPLKKEGFHAMQSGLIAETFVEAHDVVKLNKSEDETLDEEEMTVEELQECLRSMRDLLYG